LEEKKKEIKDHQSTWLQGTLSLLPAFQIILKFFTMNPVLRWKALDKAEGHIPLSVV